MVYRIIYSMQVRGGPAWALIWVWAIKWVKSVDVLYLGVYTESGRYFGQALFGAFAVTDILLYLHASLSPVSFRTYLDSANMLRKSQLHCNSPYDVGLDHLCSPKHQTENISKVGQAKHLPVDSGCAPVYPPHSVSLTLPP